MICRWTPTNYSSLGPYALAPDMGYYNLDYPYIRAIHLPTQSMLQKGTTKGFISPGGLVQGFLCFEKVDAHLKEVELVATLPGGVAGSSSGPSKFRFECKASRSSTSSCLWPWLARGKDNAVSYSEGPRLVSRVLRNYALPKPVYFRGAPSV